MWKYSDNGERWFLRDVNCLFYFNWRFCCYANKPSIQVRCVTKTYRKFGQRIEALDRMTIYFHHEELNVILGHNGSGKSCLLKIIIGITNLFLMFFLTFEIKQECIYVIGMYKPTYGEVVIQRWDKETIFPISFCPQENILVNYFTMLEHLYIFGMVSQCFYIVDMKILRCYKNWDNFKQLRNNLYIACAIPFLWNNFYIIILW
jgi:hypothetical protein